MFQQTLDQLKRSLGIMKKDIRIYYLKGPVIIFGVLIPLFLFLAFLTGSRNLPIEFLVSGLISMTILFTATSVSPVIMPWEAQMNTLERLASNWGHDGILHIRCWRNRSTRNSRTDPWSGCNPSSCPCTGNLRGCSVFFIPGPFDVNHSNQRTLKRNDAINPGEVSPGLHKWHIHPIREHALLG